MSTQKTANERLDFLRNYVKILESQFTIPGTKFKFGIDPLLNIIPGFGSYSGLILGMIFIVLAHKQEVSGKVKVLMFRNSILDFLLGSLPVAGYITDFFYKSNEKNLRLLEEHILDEKHGVDAIAFRKKAAGYIHTGHITEKNGCLILTNEGKLLADGIAASLFV